VADAAEGTRSVETDIGRVTRAAGETREAASTMNAAAGALKDCSSRLDQAVAAFLDRIRAA
jgi:hypothetical protein